MLATVLHGPGDTRCEQVAEPKILKPTDAIIKLSASCICGSDLWPYRGLQPVNEPTHMGHEYCGVVVEVGSAVKTVKPGQFVVGSFCLSDNTCPHCRFGFQSSCEQREFMSGAQAPYARVPLADGTLVATQIPYHLNRAMDNGLTRTVASEVISHLAYYAGWPNAFSAAPVARAVFEKRSAN